MQKASESYQKLFESITSIQDSFANITKKIYDNSAIQSGLSKAVQNLIPTTNLAPEMKDYLSKMAIYQSDLPRLIPPTPQIARWPKITVPEIDSGTPDASKVVSKILEEESEKPVSAMAEDIEPERYEGEVELLKGVAGMMTFLESISTSSLQSSEALAGLVSSTEEGKKIQDESKTIQDDDRKWSKWGFFGIVITIIIGLITSGLAIWNVLH